jgi:hypothetical protein
MVQNVEHQPGVVEAEGHILPRFNRGESLSFFSYLLESKTQVVVLRYTTVALRLVYGGLHRPRTAYPLPSQPVGLNGLAKAPVPQLIDSGPGARLEPLPAYIVNFRQQAYPSWVR